MFLGFPMLIIIMYQPFNWIILKEAINVKELNLRTGSAIIS